MIVTDVRNPTARAFRDALAGRLPPRPDGTLEGIPGDLVVVLGGDGFLLQTVHQLGFDRTYLGLNAGHLGFLLSDVDDWDAVADAIRAARFTVTAFPLLHARATLADGSTASEHAVNDVYLERASAQTARLALAVDGDRVVDQLVSDGVIVSTALGSTAYTFSAGGPPCHPTLRMQVVTPICPHAPRLHPFALPASARIRIDVIAAERRPVNAVVDGQSIGRVTAVEIGFADTEVRLAHLPGHDFTARMIRKILRP